MNAKTLLLTGVVVAAMNTGGCASVQAGKGFDDVGRVVENRIGKRVHWNQGTPADKAVEDEVSALLKEELTAETAVQIALLNNRSLQATYEKVNIAQADLVAAGLLRNPVFDAEIRLPIEGRGTGVELAVVQNFIDILYLPLRKSVAQSAFEAAKLQVSGTVIDLAGQVRASFYDAQASLQMLEMRQTVVAATEAAYTLARRLRVAGNITELDMSNEQALFGQAKLDLRTAELDALRTRERLNILVGLWGHQTKWTMAAKLPNLHSEEPATEGLERLAVAKSLDLAVTKMEIQQAAQTLGIARPFGVLSDAGIGMTGERDRDGDWGAGPAFSLPIPFFNQGQPAVATAYAVLTMLGERYVAQSVTLRAEVRIAQASVIAARERVEYYEHVYLPLRDQIVQQTQFRYNAMQVGGFQLLQAKRDQIEAGIEYIKAMLDYWKAHTERTQLLSGRMTDFTETIITNEEFSASKRSSIGGN